jgi:hypothetical protein
MVRLTVDEGVEAADAALAQAGAKVMASQDLQNGARTLLEKSNPLPSSSSDSTKRGLRRTSTS